ncbi:calcium/sodium antiporter [candidate division KSB1 bacterium]|nr:calcium/sodium antiporter [candidate division KSB1 bacterium]
MPASIFQIIIGLVLLTIGAEALVRGSSSLALRLKVSPVVIGLTIVAYGTSMPEMVVSVKSALADQGAIAIGNVVGSNIFNIAVILGLSSLAFPLKINIKLLRSDTPIMIIAAFLFAVFFRDHKLGFFEGAVLLLFILFYIIYNFLAAKRASSTELALMKVEIAEFKYFKNIYLEIVTILLGFSILILGAHFLIKGSVKFAQLVGMSEAVIGLTIIAVGTSLPELATSLVASIHKKPDIAVGNIIGSNIFNILGILGVATLISPINGKGIKSFDIYVMLAVSIILFPFMWSHFEIKRWEGFVLVAIYIGYMFYLGSAAS